MAKASDRVRSFFETYTRDLRSQDIQRVFTHEAPEAYRFFTGHGAQRALDSLPLHKRVMESARILFLAFTLKLSPARRAIYAAGLLMALVGLLQLFAGIGSAPLPVVPFLVTIHLPLPVWADGTMALFTGFVLINLLVLLEVADRLLLKRDLEIAREIQQAMLPREVYTAEGIEAFGLTRPANTVGGDFYDVLRLSDGRIVLALGDVAGKGSPAALLMALVIAMLRTLVEEGLEPDALVQRLNIQVSRHAPASRFVTLFLAVYSPDTGDVRYVNAGQNPPLLRRTSGAYQRLTDGGMALGMFNEATYTSSTVIMHPGDLLVVYSDGITEAEDDTGTAFEESGLQATIDRHWWQELRFVGSSILRAVETHAGDTKIADDLTVLAIRRPVPLPPG
jgi:phosphoserine phosphatase RsbU/P